VNSHQPAIIYDPAELLKRLDPTNKLELYYQLLMEENKRINLVSREAIQNMNGADEDICRPRHFVSRETTEGGFISLTKLAAQSLLPFEKLDLDKIDNYLDIGSGGGFPAIPILLTRMINQTCLLVERTKKKAGALRRILLALDIKAEIINQSFEEASLKTTFDLITLRLVKLTPRLYKRILSVLKPGGNFIFYAVPEFDPTQEDVSVTTFYYTTSSGGATGHFTLIHKKV
jgi:16S rRNA G527 N7-methylase RsmG